MQFKRKRQLLISALFVVWLAYLLRITVFRDGCFSHGLFSGSVEWIPFVYLAKLLRIRYWRYFSYLFFGNLIWFLPVGIFVRLRGGKLRHAFLCGAALSVGIELMQYVLGSGVSEVEDVILNSTGAMIGFLLCPRRRSGCVKHS